MGDYLEAYATRFELPVRSGTAVDALAKEDGRYVATAGDLRFEADNVVVATGVFQRPYVPEFAGELDPGITQLHSNDYRNLSQLQDGPVLVVGASHSGSDIAFEASRRSTTSSCRARTRARFPAPIESRRGRMVFRGLVLRRHARPHRRHADRPQDAPAHPARRRAASPLPAQGPAGGRRRARARADGRRRRTACPCSTTGASSTSRNVVWCTGFRPDYSLDPVPVRGRRRRLSGAVPGRGLLVARAVRRRAFRSCTRSRRC